MKEATGELNMTVVIVVAIAALSAFFFTVLWPLISNNMNSKTACNRAVCYAKTYKDGMVDCQLFDEDGNKQGNSFKCVWKG
jgi:hypothetical protein